MFLFFSKLLPLLIYPLGFASLALMGALLLGGRSRRSQHLSRGLIAVALVAILVPSNGQVANWLVQSLEWQYRPTEVPSAEAIVVLGGATRPQVPPRPWIDLSEEGDRVIHGVQLYQQGKAPWLIFSGGRIDWQGNSQASESADMAALAEWMGVPASAILQDPTSLNTYENAVNVKQILQARNLQSILLVTSAMHMPRSIAIFRKQGIDALPAPTDFLISEEERYQSQDTLPEVVIGLLPDAGNLNRFTRALKEYIGLIIYRLRGWA